MIFSRREKQPLSERMRVYVWPRRSWTRSAAYIKKRVLRLRATPHAIAAGFAAGVFASFTPMMGFHFLIAALLALVTRGSIIASAFGTFIGNPLTFPLIWGTTYAFGANILGLNGAAGANPDLTPYMSWSGFSFAAVWPLWKPMAVGGALLGAIGWTICYFPVRALVARYQTNRQVRLAQRAAAHAEAVAEAEAVPATCGVEAAQGADVARPTQGHAT